MSGVFNLGTIFELVDDGFDQGSFMQQVLVCAGQLLLFHVGLDIRRLMDSGIDWCFFLY